MRDYSVCKLTFNLMLVVFLFFASIVSVAEETEPVRDPTTPLGHKVIAGKVTAATSYELNSILISAQRKLAIINGQALREGQVIEGSSGVRVTHISAQRVSLQQAEKRWELILSPTTIRKH